MEVLDYILDGLEAALELERELGVKFVECSREVLRRETGDARGEGARRETRDARPRGEGERRETRDEKAEVERRETGDARVEGERRETRDKRVVFLHDKALSAGGAEMMAKIVAALGFAAEEAPVVFEKPIPRAKAYVVLGSLALRKFMPGKRGEPGQWIRSEGGKDVLVTYSPEYILRFAAVTPAVKKIKAGMWLSLKSLKLRTAS